MLHRRTRRRREPLPAISGRAEGGAFLSCALAFLLVGCGRASVNVTAPSALKCQVTLANSMDAVPAAGAAVTLSVSTNRDCAWAASSGTSWITLTSAVTGQGDGSVAYRVAENPDPAARRGTLQVNDTSLAVAQDAAPCRFVVSPASVSSAASGGPVPLQIQTQDGCAWSAASRAPWIQITSGASGSGNGAVTLTVVPNTGAARTGTVGVAGETVTVDQADGTTRETNVSCPPNLNRTAETFPASGGTSALSVSAANSCSWTATSTVSWTRITIGGSGTGSGEVRFTVEANPSTATRQGALNIAERTFTITQTGTTACGYAISPTSHAAGALGGEFSVSVNAGGTCSWKAETSASWITINSGGSGTGNGTVRLTIASNQAAARTATATIAGQTLSVTQAGGGCSYSIAPGSSVVGSSGGELTVSVSAGSSCAWTSASNTPWMSVSAGESGTGNGTVRLAVAANAGGARSGTATIAGQTFNVSQEGAACSFSISPTSQVVPAKDAKGSVKVTTSGQCAWTATANVGWLSIKSGASGRGSDSVGFEADRNRGPERTGTLTIAGQTFTVKQRGKDDDEGDGDHGRDLR